MSPQVRTETTHLCIPIKLPSASPPSLLTLVKPRLMARVVLEATLYIRQLKKIMTIMGAN